MCGICGQYNFLDGAPVIRSRVERMARSIAHRGPDDEGCFISGAIGLGFRRLSIIDLAGGHQPMSDMEESVWVIFNGEIYNFPELKQELQAFGHIFQTRSDTEVIVHGYKQWGDGILNRLNGMFGLAIWDVRRKRLVLARDPFGIKLIYYNLTEGQLSFGSEIRAVLAGMKERPAPDPNALNLFLRYRFTPSPYTMLQGIRKLAAGSMLVCEKGTARIQQWYRYEPSPFPECKREEEIEDELAELYKQSVRRHLLSDVPVGLLLSGGIDSALLLALMNLYGSSWNTYTVGYGSNFSDDEMDHARATAASFSSRHREVLLDRRRFEKALPGIVGSLEEPIASSSIVPMYFVARRAREDVKVALIGQGPDELFGGYRRHLGVRYGSLWGAIPAWMRAPAEQIIRALPRNETLKRGLHSLGVKDRTRRYQQVLSLLSGSEIDALFQEGLLEGDAGDSILDCWHPVLSFSEKMDDLGGFQFLELRSTLPDELLMFGDKLSMAHGLEVRVPYLDKEIVEYVERLPAKYKVRGGRQKWAHRRICKRFLSSEILKRKKRGFGVNVVDQWFRSSMKTQMSDILMDPESLLYRYLRSSAVQKMYLRHQSGKSDHHKVLFSLVMFEEWLRGQSSHSNELDVESCVSR